MPYFIILYHIIPYFTILLRFIWMKICVLVFFLVQATDVDPKKIETTPI